MVLDHVNHDAVLAMVDGRALGLAGHAQVETYSVLTRLPGGGRVAGPTAARLIETNFPGTVHLGSSETRAMVRRCAAAGITGGAIYDALVGACAAAHGLPLLTCDRRALDVYAAFGAEVRLVA